MFIFSKNRFQRILKLSIASALILSITSIASVFNFCNPAMQKMRSEELQKLEEADQKERQFMVTNLEAKGIDTEKLHLNDLSRRKRVGEIFAEGCISTPKDYAAAALIYQHGDVPDHFYHAYIWANRQAEIGDALDKLNGRGLAALAIDRYLINIGKKQLFGSQFCVAKTEQSKPCFSLEAIEPSFPDSLRKGYSGFTLEERISMYRNIFKNYEYCPSKCDKVLNPTPKGIVPGLW